MSPITNLQPKLNHFHKLSQELVDMIVDHLAGDILRHDCHYRDGERLKARQFKNYALVHPTFVRQVQKYIFTTFELVSIIAIANLWHASTIKAPFITHIKCLGISTRLFSDPIFPRLISALKQQIPPERTLMLRMHHDCSCQSQMFPNSSDLTIFTTLELDGDVSPRVLQLFTNLRTLSIQGMKFDSKDSTTSYPFDTIEELRLLNLRYMPIAITSSCRNLRTVIIKRLGYIILTSRRGIQDPVFKPRIKTLITSYIGKSKVHVLFDLSDLQEFEDEVQYFPLLAENPTFKIEDYMDTLRHVLHESRASLEYFFIGSYITNTSDCLAMDFSQSSRLKKVTIGYKGSQNQYVPEKAGAFVENVTAALVKQFGPKNYSYSTEGRQIIIRRIPHVEAS